jgi:hypothetical protein
MLARSHASHVGVSDDPGFHMNGFFGLPITALMPLDYFGVNMIADLTAKQ